ncbi:asparaginase [bacterium]|nr:asparaginase [bacterium]
MIVRKGVSLFFLSYLLIVFQCDCFSQRKGKVDLPTIAIVTTGGTIAEKKDPETGSLIPIVSGYDLVQAVPGISDLAKIKIFEFSNIDSSRMTPDIWKNLSKKVDVILKDTEIDGAIVTHGTDTMEVGAYFLDLTVQSEKPVVFVGAMKDASSFSPDGPENIYNALVQITSKQAHCFGVTVTLNQYIHSPRDVRKTETTNIQTFDSGKKGCLGYIAAGMVHCFRKRFCSQKFFLPKTLKDVSLIKTFAGDNGSLVRYAADSDVKGIVIEGVGAGNVNEEVYKAILYALEKDIFVVLTTAVFDGAVYPLYGGNGGGYELQQRGVIFAGDLPSEKARILLMLALAQDNSSSETIAKCFEM